mgnify:CR=1 FL=1
MRDQARLESALFSRPASWLKQIFVREISPQILAAMVQRYRPVAAGDLAFEPVATGKFNTSFFVRAGGEDLVLRIAPSRDEVFVFYERDMMRLEPAIHALLRQRTRVPVASIVAFDESHELIERSFMLMERLPGKPLGEAPQVDFAQVLRQVGEFLAEVHGIGNEKFGYLGAHHPMEGQDSWAAAFALMWRKLIDDIVGVGYYDQGDSRLLLGLLEQHLGLFERPVSARLLHMDIWHQNILVDDLGLVRGLVDWDRALWGDPEIEFAVLDYCGIAEPAFWEGYGRQRDASDEARVRQVFYLLYELQKYIVIRAGRNRDPAGARRYKGQVMKVVENFM